MPCGLDTRTRDIPETTGVWKTYRFAVSTKNAGGDRRGMFAYQADVVAA